MLVLVTVTMTLLPCGMPSTGSDRLLSTVMEEIDRIPTPSPTLTPEEVERIGRLNEARWPASTPDPNTPALPIQPGRPK